MNKKGSWSIQQFLTAGFIYALIAFIIFFIVGGGGGFEALYKFGGYLKMIPWWGYAIAAGLYLFSILRN